MTKEAPTTEQIKKAQKNLQNMIAFSTYLHANAADTLVDVAAGTLSLKDDSDWGWALGLNVLESVFWAVAGIEGAGPIGGFAASFLSGVVSQFATSAPLDFQAPSVDLKKRMLKQQNAIEDQLAKLGARDESLVKQNWDTPFTYNGKTATLSDLGSATSGIFPVEGDVAWGPMRDAAEKVMNQQIWRYFLVSKYRIVVRASHAQDNEWGIGGDRNVPPVAYVKQYIKDNPAYNLTWRWHNHLKCGDGPDTGWVMSCAYVSTGPSMFAFNALNTESCKVLFYDSAPGEVLNPDGLFTRNDVFNNIGIQLQVLTAEEKGTADKVSVEYLRAMKDGNTLGLLIERESRAAVEKRVIDKAREDPLFAADLKLRPRQTLEMFLGIRIPEVISVDVIVESGDNYGLVIPKS
jgi:hypothetical protein